MKLDYNSLKESTFWEENDIELPLFNIEEVNSNTVKNPKWIHFGAGNIFKAFICNRYQEILNKGLENTGIVAVESFDFEVVEKLYKPFNNMSLVILTKADGSNLKRVVASVSESYTTKDEKLKELILNPELQMVSFTITEKGYAIKKQDGELFDIVKSDIENKLETPIHVMSYVTSLLYKRYQNGGHPVTMVSMDNCSHNGDKLKAAIIDIASIGVKEGFLEQGFVDYLTDKTKITFPLSMIDKITPRPAENFKNDLEKIGLENMDVVITQKNTYMAPFVNAEISEYLVIEDSFVNGRPKLEEAGIIFTDRETVNNVETMKVTTCLNPLHTALAVTGCLLGYTLIADEMNNPTLRKLVEKIGYDEGLKVVNNPGIIDPKKFIDEVVNERLTNPSIPDTPQRIATDTSQKVGIRFGETIKAYYKSDDLKTSDLTGISLAIASWLRYLHGIDDSGNKFTLSSDPELELLQEKVKNNNVKWIISNENIFGMDLYKADIGNKVEGFYNEMLQGNGSIIKTLENYL